MALWSILWGRLCQFSVWSWCKIIWNKIFFLSRRHLVLNCEGDLHIFPFDSPMCTFAIESGEQICIFVFYANFWHSMSSWTSNLRISLRGCISSFLFPKCDIFHCKDVGNVSLAEDAFHPLYSAAVTSFLNFRQYFPALISHPPVQKVFFSGVRTEAAAAG